MKSPQPADARSSASTPYAPSVPMSVYRELAAELRANKAVIDSLNSRNQQLIQQNQRLKQEIQSVVQAAMSLGQTAGVARPPQKEGFPSAIAPDTLAKLVQAHSEGESADTRYSHGAPAAAHQSATVPPTPNVVPATPHNRVPQPIQSKSPRRPVGERADYREEANMARAAAKRSANKSGRPSAKAPSQRQSVARVQSVPRQQPVKTRGSAQRTDVVMMTSTQPAKAAVPKKLFTEQTGELRNAPMDSIDEKEISGIWLALSIILIIMTAFGAGFLIMKPLLNNR